MKETRDVKHIFLENELLLENLQGGIVYSDFEPPFYLRYVTQGMADLCGYTQEELLAMKQMDIVYPEDIDAVSQEVGTQLSMGDTFEVVYRLLRKDGSCVDVLDRAKVVLHEDGNKYIHCLLTDISAQKSLEKALRLSEEKYLMSMTQSGNVILEYDPETNYLSFSENFRDVFPGQDIQSGSLDDIIAQSAMMESCPQVVPLLERTIAERSCNFVEYEMHLPGRWPVWCSLHLTPVTDGQGHVCAVIGCLQNIDSRKRQVERLTELSQTDSLTGVFNRRVIENAVNQRLKSPAQGTDALMILDIDFFKQVNDQFGHDFGDRVLQEVSAQIASLLPPEALFGRLGGDEFLIFSQGMETRSAVAQLAEHIVSGVRSAFASATPPITISLGVACRKSGEGHFQLIYKRADLALYETKGKGRNGYTLCPEE